MTEDEKRLEEEKEKRNLQSLLSKHNNDAMALASDLLSENAEYRRKNALFKTEITDLKAKVPSDGAVMLGVDEIKAWEAYRAEGTPDDFKKAKTSVDTLTQENVGLKETNAKTARAQLLRDIADEVAPGVKFKSSVLARLDADTPGLSYEHKEVQENGQKVRKAFVKFKDGEGDQAPVKELALLEFAQTRAEWKDFLPALQVGETQPGTRHVAQGGGGDGSAPSKYDQLRQQNGAKAQDEAKSERPSLEKVMNLV